MEYLWVEVKIEWDERPGHDEWKESDKGISRLVASSTTCLDHILGAGRSALAI